MSLFGGSGFLGLKDSKFGETVSDIGGFVEDAGEFAVELPNKIIDLGENLGNQTFDTSSETAENYKRELSEFRSRQMGGNIGQQVGGFLSQNIMLIGVVLIGFLILKD